MGLIDRFQALFRPNTQQVVAVTEVEPPPRPMALYQRFAVENDRRSVVQDCRRMYDDDPRAQGVIETLASDLTQGGFELSVEGPRSDEAKRIADEMLVRTGFWEHIPAWVEDSLIDGDTFLEVGATSTGDLATLSRKPTLEMVRLSDDFDQFANPAKAFAWSETPWMMGSVPGDAVYFAEWQMIHARARKRSNGRYGRPLFSSARKSFKRLSEGELDISVRRKTRAGMKFLHSLEDAGEDDIKAYMKRNKAALDDPFAAVADFFANKKANVSAIQGDAHLSEIDDVMHHIRTWWLASPVPMSLLGYGQDLNRDVLEKQEKQYQEAIQARRGWVTSEFVQPLIERQWLLKGIWPDNLTWSVQWASKQVLSADTLDKAAAAALKLKALGLPDDVVIRILSLFVPEMDAQAVIDALVSVQNEAGNVAAGV